MARPPERARSVITIDLASQRTLAALFAVAVGFAAWTEVMRHRPDVMILVPLTFVVLAGVLSSNGALVIIRPRRAANRSREVSPMWDLDLDP